METVTFNETTMARVDKIELIQIKEKVITIYLASTVFTVDFKSNEEAVSAYNNISKIIQGL